MKSRFFVLATLVAMTMGAFAQEVGTDAPTQKASFWKKGCDLSLQFTQNYASENWYTGGNSSMAGLFELDGWFNYDDGKAIIWENLVELDYGLSTTFTRDKAGRVYHVTDDNTKWSTKFGYKAVKNWYYAAMGEVSTTLFDTYTIDTNDKTSAFATPVRFYFGIGMDYKYANDKGTELSVYISPITYKLTYMNDTTSYWKTLDEADGCISIPEHLGFLPQTRYANQYGAHVKFDLIQTFNQFVSLESRMSLFTNYNGNSKGTVGLEADWEIIANFNVYKYLTARLVLHPRYDSTVEGGWNWTLEDGTPGNRIQFKEFLSIGLAYSFGTR